MSDAPALNNVYLFVRDMPATLAFYGRLGLTFDAPGGMFVRAEMPKGSAGLEFGTAELTRSYDPRFEEPVGVATGTLNFSVPSRQAVDDLYAELTRDGDHAYLAPIDAFWGSRFAILLDPDGNQVGLHSPRDPAMARRPDA